MTAWYRDRHAVALVGMFAAAALLLAALVMGLVAFLKMRQVVTEEFNGQQLVLARNLATLIHQDLDFLRRELLVLGQSTALDLPSEDRWRDRMQAALDAMEGGEVLELGYLDSEGREVVVVRPGGGGPNGWLRGAEERLRQWAASPLSAGEVLVVPVHAASSGRDRLTLLMATPRRARAAGDPGAGNAGVLAFAVDATALSSRFTADARSGTTGYAWVIDERGTFLAHPMSDFIGKSAFTARHERDPRLGFDGINAIMRDFMLRGQEGMGEYESGWHRQEVGPVRKLIAYCPIPIEATGPAVRWSVAVVAPVAEVQPMVRALFLRQLAVQLAIVLAIGAGAISLLWVERYWLTVQREKERQVHLSARLASLGTLAAGVAHEVNNPIAIILGFTDLLLERTPPGTEAHEYLTVIDRQAAACKRIVENLNTFARVPAPRGDGLDVNAELRRLLSMVRNTLVTEKIQCEEDLQPALPATRGDSQGFQQVVLNLITNARAAMRSGGRLRVASRAVPGGVEVEVSDTGQGIPRPHLERIFDPFFTTKAPGEGTGLGLSISHGIIEQAGGTIAVESRDQAEVGPDRCGTTFRIFLPVFEAPDAAPAESA